MGRKCDAVLAVLRREGFSVVAATHANWILDSYLYGFALQVATLPFDTQEELAATSYDPATEFEVGLDLILDALEGLRSATDRAVR